MNLESLEHVEAVSHSEIVQDTIEPLNEGRKEAKEGVSAPLVDMEAIPKLETTEVITDLEMAEGIANYLETVEEIKLENWNKLSLESKTEVLNRIEQQVAAIEHRPALKVELELMQPQTLGYQSASEHKIALNTLFVDAEAPNIHREVIDTIIHEGRHAYQHYNVDVKPIHESGAEVETWRENFYDPRYQYYQSTGQKIVIPYHDGSWHNVDYRLYYYQPVEIDARNFAKDVMSRLEDRGVVSPSTEQNEMEGGMAKAKEAFSSVSDNIKVLAPRVEITSETKAAIDFYQKMKNGEVGANDELKGSTEGYLIFDWEHNKLFSPPMADNQIKVYKDAGTGRLFVQEHQGYTAPLEKSDLWKPEGFSYSYQNALGLEIAVKMF